MQALIAHKSALDLVRYVDRGSRKDAECNFALDVRFLCCPQEKWGSDVKKLGNKFFQLQVILSVRTTREAVPDCGLS
jgi:hypothetical protein